ncbi:MULTISPECIES: hypothetical protein [unclassified Pseudomonas]|uniref:hypothetical protein n=1 Tax=unclassified Pseudomonas TaxID=196821 RepID=UPI00381007AF
MNISPKPNRSTRKPRTSIELPQAPIDCDYGIHGLAYIFEKIAGSRANTNAIINSTVSAGRSYVIGESYNPQTSEAKVFVACLKDLGTLDNSFGDGGIFDFNKAASTDYMDPKSIVEDAAGNILIALKVVGQSASHLWKLSAGGQPDPNFGDRKGYVDTRHLIGEELVLEHLAVTKGHIFATGGKSENFEPVVLGLDNDGALRADFGDDGLVDVSKLIPDTDSHIVDGIASFTSPSNAQQLVLTWYLIRGEDPYSVTTAMTPDGKVDDNFGTKGFHWSAPWIINNGFSVDPVAKRITFYGELYDVDEDISHPTVYRIDYSGAPAREFNGGEALVFDKPGGWYAGVETAGGLVGYGHFYTYSLAFSLTSEGTFDTRFVPPFGYGQFGAQIPEDGFYASGSTVSLDAGNQRLLINGRDEEVRGSTVPCVAAVALPSA